MISEKPLFYSQTNGKQVSELPSLLVGRLSSALGTPERTQELRGTSYTFPERMNDVIVIAVRLAGALPRSCFPTAGIAPTTYIRICWSPTATNDARIQ